MEYHGDLEAACFGVTAVGNKSVFPCQFPQQNFFFHVLYLGHLHNIYFKKEKVFQLD